MLFLLRHRLWWSEWSVILLVGMPQLSGTQPKGWIGRLVLFRFFWTGFYVFLKVLKRRLTVRFGSWLIFVEVWTLILGPVAWWQSFEPVVLLCVRIDNLYEYRLLTAKTTKFLKKIRQIESNQRFFRKLTLNWKTYQIPRVTRPQEGFVYLCFWLSARSTE